MLVFLREIVKREIRFKIISANRIIYSAEIHYKNKKIKLKCSYRLTMLPLQKLAELAEIEEKEVFPYKILNKELEKTMEIKKEMFKNEEEFIKFTKKNGYKIDTFKILEEYCKNDAIITKKSIIKY
jgi:hypothetical protein